MLALLILAFVAAPLVNAQGYECQCAFYVKDYPIATNSLAFLQSLPYHRQAVCDYDECADLCYAEGQKWDNARNLNTSIVDVDGKQKRIGEAFCQRMYLEADAPWGIYMVGADYRHPDPECGFKLGWYPSGFFTSQRLCCRKDGSWNDSADCARYPE